MCLRLRLIASKATLRRLKEPQVFSPSLGPFEQPSSPEELFASNVCLNLRHRNSSKVLRLWHSGGLLKWFHVSLPKRNPPAPFNYLPPTFAFRVILAVQVVKAWAEAPRGLRGTNLLRGRVLPAIV